MPAVHAAGSTSDRIELSATERGSRVDGLPMWDATRYREYNDCCNAHRFDALGAFVAPDVRVNDERRASMRTSPASRPSCGRSPTTAGRCGT